MARYHDDEAAHARRAIERREAKGYDRDNIAHLSAEVERHTRLAAEYRAGRTLSR